jgi:hypothetical protein
VLYWTNKPSKQQQGGRRARNRSPRVHARLQHSLNKQLGEILEVSRGDGNGEREGSVMCVY